MNRWIKKIYINRHTYKWNIIQPEKKEVLPFKKAWMDLEGIMPSEIN